MKRLFLVLIVSLALIGVAYGANTVTTEKNSVVITPDGSTDFTSAEITGASAGGEVTIYSIQFNPSAAADQLILNNNSIDGVPLFDSGAVESTSPVIKYFPGGKRTKIVMDASDCTFGTAANVRIYFELK